MTGTPDLFAATVTEIVDGPYTGSYEALTEALMRQFAEKGLTLEQLSRPSHDEPVAGYVAAARSRLRDRLPRLCADEAPAEEGEQRSMTPSPWTGKHVQFTPEQHEQFLELKALGLPVRMIARQMGMSVDRVRARLPRGGAATWLVPGSRKWRVARVERIRANIAAYPSRPLLQLESAA